MTCSSIQEIFWDKFIVSELFCLFFSNQHLQESTLSVKGDNHPPVFCKCLSGLRELVLGHVMDQVGSYITYKVNFILNRKLGVKNERFWSSGWIYAPTQAAFTHTHTHSQTNYTVETNPQLIFPMNMSPWLRTLSLPLPYPLTRLSLPSPGPELASGGAHGEGLQLFSPHWKTSNTTTAS